MAFYPSYDLVDCLLPKTDKQLVETLEASTIIRVAVHHFQDKVLERFELNLTIVVSNYEERAYASYLIELWMRVITICRS